MPSSGRKEDEQGPQDLLVDEASTNLSSAITEKSTGPPATDKTGSEKANGSGTHDKGKKTRGEPPFTKQEQVEMEALLDELCGHLGQSWIGGSSCYCWRSPALFDLYSCLSNPVLGRRRCREQLLVQY